MVSKVSEKSTKPEIWAAYQAALAEFQGRPVAVASGTITKVSELGAVLEQSKSELIAKFETAHQAASSVADDCVAAEQTLAKRKAEIVDQLERSRTELQAAVDQARKEWEQELADTKRARDREVEEYNYELNKKRRSEEESFQAKWQTKFAELDAREVAVKDREGQLTELERAVAGAPEQLQKAVKEACDALAKELKVAHDNELKETRQQLDHQKSILELKLQTAEASISAKDKRIVDLQAQLDNSSDQLKDMAVTVIRASNPPAAPASPAAT